MKKVLWPFVALLGAFALGVIALQRGETINAAWIVTATVCLYLIAYRYYGLFIAKRVLGIDSSRSTPAHNNNDGLDYVPTDKKVLFGHHFAAIAGAGPLMGPILAAQMGYLPSLLWLVVGVVFAGAVQDMVILFFSVRRNGRSLGEMVRSEMGPIPGVIAAIGTFIIMIILIAVLSLIVVKALTQSPWGTFTIAATIPIAFFMGIYSRYWRPGRIGEMSIIGVLLLIGSIILGGQLKDDPTFTHWFLLNGTQLTWCLMVYGFFASVLPIWLLLAPRDYLSTYLKIGTIVIVAVSICTIWPTLKMPPLTIFTDGNGPVYKGTMFPFLFITLACGAVSGFHALIASGTTPKMIHNERDIPFIGYGAMLMESFVGIIALIAACSLEPGVYFAINSPAAVIGTTAATAASAISHWGFMVTPDMLTNLAKEVGEHTILSRVGGAPTFAIGMAEILSKAMGGLAMKAFWYHFAILFEALFILTAIDAGTRTGRFILQDSLSYIMPFFKRTESFLANAITSFICVALWGYFLYQGVVDPWGGINTLWPLFGIANQVLAAIALLLATSILFKMKRQNWAWVTGIPAVWALIFTLSAAFEKLFSADPAIGFLARAQQLTAGIDSGIVIAPTKTFDQMRQVVLSNHIDSVLTGIMVLLLISMTCISVRVIWQALCAKSVTTNEDIYTPISHTKSSTSV
jgi:carbon starvation protein CstA